MQTCGTQIIWSHMRLPLAPASEEFNERQTRGNCTQLFGMFEKVEKKCGLQSPGGRPPWAGCDWECCLDLCSEGLFSVFLYIKGTEVGGGL